MAPHITSFCNAGEDVRTLFDEFALEAHAWRGTSTSALLCLPARPLAPTPSGPSHPACPPSALLRQETMLGKWLSSSLRCDATHAGDSPQPLAPVST